MGLVAWIHFAAGSGIFHFRRRIQGCTVPDPRFYQWKPRFLSSGVKRPAREAHRYLHIAPISGCVKVRLYCLTHLGV